jgi:hypothetical protein
LEKEREGKLESAISLKDSCLQWWHISK